MTNGSEIKTSSSASDQVPKVRILLDSGCGKKTPQSQKLIWSKIYIKLVLCDRLPTISLRVSWANNQSQMEGSITEWLAYLVPDPAAQGLSCDSRVFSEKILIFPIFMTAHDL